MANHPSPLRRYIFRKDFFQKLDGKRRDWSRKIFKSDLSDIKGILKEDVNVIFDVGANIGESSSRYAKEFPSASIYAFEPYQPIFEKLSSRFDQHQRVKLFQLAISSENKLTDFFIGKYDVMNSLLKPSAAWGFDPDPKTIAVKTITLDEFCHQQGLLSIDLLKIDIQGGELDALKGSHQLLSDQAIGLIYMECQLLPLYENQPTFHDLYTLLTRYEYTFFNFYRVRETRNGQIRWFDGLFVNKRYSANK